MGNRRKLGTRHKLCKKQGPRKSNNTKLEQCENRKPSRSKVKLDSNFDYYKAQNDTLEYEIVDISKLESALTEIAVCKFCGNSLKLSKKSLVGLATKITITCLNCNEGQSTFNNCDHINVRTSQKDECNALTPMYDLNIRLVYGMRVIGKGFTSARSLCGILNIPPPPTVFSKYERVLGQATDSVCKESMHQAVTEAIAVNCNEDREPRDLCVALDGSWQKRGHQSLNGIVSVTSVDTGKVIDIHCMSKHCLCPRKLQNDHEESCIGNYSGTSGGMESEGAVTIFQRSLEKYNVRYIDYLGDGDSNAYLSVCESKPYGDTKINKLECVGHIQKRMGTRLRTLKMKSKNNKLADGKSLSGKNRLTDLAVQKLQIFYGLAIRRNCQSLPEMQKAIWATYFHIMSCNDEPRHELCPKEPTTWCKFNIAIIENKEYDHTKHFHLPEIIMTEIKPIFRDLSNPELLRKCLAGLTQNPNESLNNLIWSRIPKRTFVKLNTLKFGVQDAVLSFNDGYCSKCKVIHSLGLKIGHNLLSTMKRLDYERIMKSEKAAEEIEKKIRQSRTLLKRKLEDQYLEAEDPDNPSYSAGGH